MFDKNFDTKISNDSNSEQLFANFPDIEFSNETNDTLNDISFNFNNTYNKKNDCNTKDVIIYETNSEDSFNYDSSYDNNNIDVFDVNHYENKIKRLESENSKLNQQLIELEEQIIDLINDKKCLEKSTKTRIDSLKQKLDSYVFTIEELKQNILSLESINCEIEDKLNQKQREMEKIKTYSQEVEDKVNPNLFFSSFQLFKLKQKSF